MNKVKKLLLVMASALVSAAVISNSPRVNVNALEDYVNEEGETQYGWHIIANETNASCFEFADNGELSYCSAAEGDTSDQRVNNYAIRNLAINSDDSYTVSATFVPDEESDTSVERTYGILAWYQDPDNFIIYWLNQKANEWSGQLYGRVGGAFRKLWIPKGIGNIPVEDYWRKGEYYDMWWDANTAAHPQLCGNRTALLNHSVNLEVESSIETCTVGGEEYTCRQFTLAQTVGDERFELTSFYIQQITADKGPFYTGVYSECFNVGIEDFQVVPTNTNFAANVVQSINNLPNVVEGMSQVNIIAAVRGQYEGLLSFKSGVSAEELAKLEAAEDKIGDYVDGEIEGLDYDSETYPTDVTRVYDLYVSLPEMYQDKVSKVDDLVQAVNNAKTWVKPSERVSEEPTIEPSEEPSVEPSVAQSVVQSEEVSVEPSVQPSVEATSQPKEDSQEVKTEESKSNDVTTSEQIKDEPSKKGCKGVAAPSLLGLVVLAGSLLISKKRK